MITFKQLRYALAVEEYLHFHRAADACAISQSALSTAINDMEKQLGFQVFERDNKKVLITPLGRALLDKARTIYIEMNDLANLADAIKEPLSTPLSVGIIPTIAPFLLPLILPEITVKYPKLTLRVEEDHSQQLVDKVLSGELDTAILALPYDCKGLLSFPFWDEDFFLVTAQNHALSHQSAVHAEQIRLSNLMLLKDGHCLKDHVLAVCQFKNEAAISIGGTSLSTLVQLVAGGLGTTLVPEMALAQLVDNNRALAAIPLTEPGPHRRIAFIVRPNYPALENIERLKALARAQRYRVSGRSQPAI